jgi:hypothetical protein
VETEELNSGNRRIFLLTAVGAGINHHSELDVDLYKLACVYTDTMASAETELKGLLEEGMTIEEVGDIINGTKSADRGMITVFQSLGKVIPLCIEPWFNLFKYVCMIHTSWSVLIHKIIVMPKQIFKQWQEKLAFLYLCIHYTLFFFLREEYRYVRSPQPGLWSRSRKDFWMESELVKMYGLQPRYKILNRYELQ